MKRWLLVCIILLFAPRAMAQGAAPGAPSCDQVATAVYNELEGSGVITNRTYRVVIPQPSYPSVFDPVLQEFWNVSPGNAAKSGWLSGLGDWAGKCDDYFSRAEQDPSKLRSHTGLCAVITCNIDSGKQIYYAMSAYVMESLQLYAGEIARTRADQEQAQQRAEFQAQQAQQEAVRKSNDQQYRATLASTYGVPACDSDELLQAVKRSVAGSPSGRTSGLRLLDIEDVKDISAFDPNSARRTCSGHADFNNGERYITFGARLIKGKGIMVNAQWPGSGAPDYRQDYDSDFGQMPPSPSIDDCAEFGGAYCHP